MFRFRFYRGGSFHHYDHKSLLPPTADHNFLSKYKTMGTESFQNYESSSPSMLLYTYKVKSAINQMVGTTSYVGGRKELQIHQT